MTGVQSRMAAERQRREHAVQPLSPRRLQALTLYAAGKSVLSISCIMDVMPHTVEGLLYKSAVNLGVAGPDARARVVIEARRLGLIP